MDEGSVVTSVRRELDMLDIHPLRRFGQHFLIDKRVRDELIDQAEITKSDTVLEVGPGLGFLTAALVSKAGRVIAVEKDRTLAAHLKDKFSTHKNLTLIQADVLSTRIPDDTKVVSSPPYNISSGLVLLITSSKFRLASLLLQEEFVRRLAAPSGSREYGRLTVMVGCKAETKFVKKVPRNSFYPKPRVDSALVRMVPHEPPPVQNGVLFEEIVRNLFTQRRRKLRGVLGRFLKRRFPNQSTEVLRRTFVPEKRVFETTLQEFVALSNQIAEATTQ